MLGIAWIFSRSDLCEEVPTYRLESGNPISCGASSIWVSPALLVSVLYIVGSNKNSLSLYIDHEDMTF